MTPKRILLEIGVPCCGLRLPRTGHCGPAQLKALEAIIAEHLTDSRHGLNTQFQLTDLLRQSIYSRLAGYEDLNDAARLSTDPRSASSARPSRGTGVRR